ncbi:MAG: hypothetical protein IJU50_03850, partial [Lachnospiraceae bacterium]|nr:hypothetical protein [Lachnospiraceae bacterium]
MRKVLLKEEDDEKQEEKGSITEEQKEGIRAILAWMYRNCNKTDVSKEPFVYKLTQAPPEQLLLMFYLVENEKQSSMREVDFHAAQMYTPDVEAFKSKVVASKLKFWKRMRGSDSVIDWRILGEANRSAMSCEAVKEYAPVAAQLEEAQEKLSSEEAVQTKEKLLSGGYEKLTDKEPDQQKVQELQNQQGRLLEAISQEGNMLLMYYQSAGYPPDMPVDMLPEEKLRKKALSLHRQLNNHLAELLAITQRIPETLRTSQAPAYKKLEAKPDDGEEEEDEDEESPVMDAIEQASDIIYTGMNVEAAISIAGKYVQSLTDAVAYSAPASGLYGIAGVLGVVAAFREAYVLGKGASILSAADHTAQALSVTSNVLSNLGYGGQGVVDFLGNFITLGEEAEEATSWLGSTTAQSVGEAFETVSGGATFVAGALVTVAGTVQTISGAINLGRAYSSQNDVKRANKKLDEAGQLSEDQQQLRSFLKHQEREVSRQKLASGVDMASGLLMAAGGVLMMTGILAPFGGILTLLGSAVDIGLGRVLGWHKRRENRKLAVDEYLDMDNLVKKVKKEHPSEKVRAMKEDKLRNLIRQEALAELGYATYKECFADLSKKNAQLLYRHVFVKPDGTYYTKEEHEA